MSTDSLPIGHDTDCVFKPVTMQHDSVLTAFIQHARHQPHALAMLDAGRAWNREQLLALVSSMTGGLLQAGVSRGDVVALSGSRSVWQVAAMLSCWMVGATILPFEVTLPIIRRQAMIKACAARFHVGTAGEPSLEELTFLDMRLLAKHAPVSCIQLADAHAAAYVLFTSGTTGTPKGVLISQAALAARMAGMQEVMSLSASDRMLYRTPLGFDVAMEEIGWPLSVGAVVVCAPPACELDAQRLADVICASHVTVIDVVPGLLASLLDVPCFRDCASLRRVLCGGEALSMALLRRFMQTMPQVELCNIYGPTEAVINALWWRARSDWQGVPPIGKPLPGTGVSVRNDQGMPVPQGERGELWLSGILAEGYLGNADLTRDKFPVDAQGERWYRTGDLVQLCATGECLFHGRIDHQVKIRGARIELPEIETALQQLPGVRQCCVQAVGTGDDAQLVAWLATDLQRSATAWRADLATRLPLWMRPGRYVQLERLPLNHNGKVDRSALLQTLAESHEEWGASPPGVVLDVASADSPLIALVRSLFCVQLKRESVNDDVDFFEAGGDSLKAMDLLLSLESMLGVNLPIWALYQHASVRALCRHIEECKHNSALFNLKDEFGQHAAVFPAVPQQPNLQRLRAGHAGLLVLVHPGDGGTSMYLPLLRMLRSQPDVVAFAAWDLRQRHYPKTTVADIAADYVAQLNAEYPEAPLCLLGWSSGAVVAYEMAHGLRQQGRSVTHLGMADPFEDWELERTPENSALPVADASFTRDDWTMVMRTLALGECVEGRDASFWQQPEPVLQQRMLQSAKETGRVPLTLSVDEFAYLCRVIKQHADAYDRYVPRRTDQDMTIFLPAPQPLTIEQWQRASSGSCRVVYVGGEHLTMMRAPFVLPLAATVDAWFGVTT